MSGCTVQIKVVFLDIFAMIAFAICQPKQSLLQDWINTVPERYSKAKKLLVIGKSCQSIFTPPVGTRAGLIVGKVVPRIAVFTIIFAHRSPLSLAQVRSPLAPWNSTFVGFSKPLLLGKTS